MNRVDRYDIKKGERMKISYIKIKEILRLTNFSQAAVSKYFKEASDEDVKRVNNRVSGISPEAANRYLIKHNIDCFNQGGVILSANLCGGVGKTSGIYSLSCALRRVTDRIDPIVLIDTDSQGSLTSSIFGDPASDNDPILIDYLEGKASVEDILTNVGENMWCIKSNLNQVYIDKILSKPSEIKNSMHKLYKEIFSFLGDKSKIFQDHTPQLSSVFASSICALFQLNKKFMRSVIIPMRSDKYAVDGAEKILHEIYDLKDTFNLTQELPIHCYFSSIDQRISTTSAAIKAAQKKSDIIKNLSPVVIRYCSEIPKSIQRLTNVYSSGKANKAAEDYQDLLHSIFMVRGE